MLFLGQPKKNACCYFPHDNGAEWFYSLLRFLSAKIVFPQFFYTVLMGNHDCFSLTQNEFYSIIGDEARPTPFIFENKTVIFMDACYYSNGEHYSPEKSHDWMDTNCQSPTKLQEELKAVNGFCYIFIHQNLDPDIPESCRLNNDKTVRKILEDSGKVITVFQGHYHLGNKKRVNGIEYITIPAMCENEKAFFIYQL